MARHGRYSSVLPWAPVSGYTVLDRFRYSLNIESLEYIFVIHSVPSTNLISKGFSLICKRHSRQLRRSHHFSVSFVNDVIRDICLEQVIHCFTVESNGFFLPTLVLSRSLWNVHFECGGSGALHEKCNNHRPALLCSPFASHASFEAKGKLNIEICSNKSNICDFVWTCSCLVHFATLFTTSSS